MTLRDANLKAALAKHVRHVQSINDDANRALKGVRVRIVSDYNGQPYGRSKPSLKGTICTVDSVSIDDNRAHIFLKEYLYGHPSVGLNDIEFIEA